jgi:hypothetical protein
MTLGFSTLSITTLNIIPTWHYTQYNDIQNNNKNMLLSCYALSWLFCSKCHYLEYHYAECHYAESHYTECCGTFVTLKKKEK